MLVRAGWAEVVCPWRSADAPYLAISEDPGHELALRHATCCRSDPLWNQNLLTTPNPSGAITATHDPNEASYILASGSRETLADQHRLTRYTYVLSLVPTRRPSTLLTSCREYLGRR